MVKGNVTDPKEAIALLLPIDDMLQKWKDQLPPAWTPTICDCPTQVNSLVDSLTPDCNIYQDLWSASIWNNYRCVRILIHDTILSLSTDDPSEWDDNMQSSAKIMHEMIMDICRSVPFHLGHNHMPNGKGLNTGAYVIIWPLYMAGTQATMTTDQRKWVGRQLWNIGMQLGVRLALVLATSLRKARIKGYAKREVWIPHKLPAQGTKEEQEVKQPELYDEI
jgi:hypothetical protein